jgi:hypothetical protein
MPRNDRLRRGLSEIFGLAPALAHEEFSPRARPDDWSGNFLPEAASDTRR